MTDQRKEQNQPENHHQPVNDAHDSDELSEEELNNISGGGTPSDKKTGDKQSYLEFKLDNTMISSYTTSG